ncbi:MAG TPA: BsuBI/PstI family type II restriction endonuclease [Verrucomicrobiae bacterium]|nr:BsuBI/PstI family type II restriction endonuclease [Verrucomicrobiae bacterium]
MDAVFCLLDDISPSFFGEAAQKGLKVCHGASTAHIACHVGVLQRNSTKLDREGRDYWLKPLWEIGALEKLYFDPGTADFMPGHPVPKSPNSAYRIAPAFLEILKAPDAERSALLKAWAGDDAKRARLQVQATLAETTRAKVGTPHMELITAAAQVYVPNFLPGFDVLYIDATDGQRVTPKQKQDLNKAGITIELDDSMPDILLWNPMTDELWVIEAVTSDGEVDFHKVEALTALAKRSGKKAIGFTTAYMTWKDAAARQGKHKNVAPDTYIWIREDGAKQFSVETFESSPQRLNQ